jgi:hypothetical protein
VVKRSKSLVLRRRYLPARRREPAELPTPCPHCGRLTLTVGRGTCADCWQPKLPGGEPAIAPRDPGTEPFGLFDFVNDVPDIVWILVLIAAFSIAVRLVVGLLL